MFVLIKLKDTIRVPPNKLEEPVEGVLIDELNMRFANKVMLDIGLVICLFDIAEIGESSIYCGDGAIHTQCTCRMIVFRPAIGEIICGTLKSSSKEGLSVSIGFFDSITIPPENLCEPANFNETDQTWTWHYVDEEDKQHNLLLEVGDQIRFRVHKEIFVDVSPQGPSQVNASVPTPGPSLLSEGEKTEVPYTIIGSISESGLGMTSWWK